MAAKYASLADHFQALPPLLRQTPQDTCNLSADCFVFSQRLEASRALGLFLQRKRIIPATWFWSAFLVAPTHLASFRDCQRLSERPRSLFPRDGQEVCRERAQTQRAKILCGSCKAALIIAAVLCCTSQTTCFGSIYHAPRARGDAPGHYLSRLLSSSVVEAHRVRLSRFCCDVATRPLVARFVRQTKLCAVGHCYSL